MSFVIIYRKLCDGENGAYRTFFLGRSFVFALICTLISEKIKHLINPKNLNTFPKNLGFPALGGRAPRFLHRNSKKIFSENNEFGGFLKTEE